MEINDDTIPIRNNMKLSVFNPLGAGPYFRIHSTLTKPFSCIDNLVQICD